MGACYVECVTSRHARQSWDVIARVCFAALLISSACKRASPLGRPQPASRAAANVQQARVPDCASRAEFGCDARGPECQAQLFELARCLTQREGERPPLRLITLAESKREQLEHRRATSSARAALERAVHSLGLGQSPSLVCAESSSNPGGAYYAPRERAVYLVMDDDDAPLTTERTALSLVHEYVHALQDERGELLSALDVSASQTFDRELTLWSTFEGEATLHEEIARRLARGLVSHAGLTELFAQRTDGTDAAIIRQRRPLEASLAMFPYTYGAHWAAATGARPASSYEILAQRHDWSAAPTTPCTDDGDERSLPTRDTLGAWFVQSFVRRITGDPVRARSAAQRWRGDSIGVDPVAVQPHFTWQTCWDSRETALEMRTLIETQLSKAAPGLASVTVDARRVTAKLGVGTAERR